MMKWKQFLIVWLVILLLAPSIWVHKLEMEGAPPPGSDIEPPPLFIRFGVVYFGRQLVEQLAGGDFGDALAIFLVIILPILIYTFFLSYIIYYCFRKVRHRFSG
ncbi:hypothetical protein ES703_119682 [subsurface metagenome]